jgi:hypothetical protein
VRNSLLILNPEKAEFSKLGYDEIYISQLIQGMPDCKNEDDYKNNFYECLCLVKEGELSSLITIPFHLMSDEIKNGIYYSKK